MEEHRVSRLSALADPSDMPVFRRHADLPAISRRARCAFPTDQESLWYHYGAALFWLFLEDAHGQGDGKLLAKIWQAARQNGTVVSPGNALLDVPNEPDVLDAITTVTGEPLANVMSEFAVWRHFVGARDDGEHFAHASQWFGADATIDTTRALAELPIVDAMPSVPLAAYGTSYIERSTGLAAGNPTPVDGDPSVAGRERAARRTNNTPVRRSRSTNQRERRARARQSAGFSRAASGDQSESRVRSDAPACNVKPLSLTPRARRLATPPSVLGIDRRASWASTTRRLTGSDFAGLSVALGTESGHCGRFVDSTGVAEPDVARRAAGPRRGGHQSKRKIDDARERRQRPERRRAGPSRRGNRLRLPDGVTQCGRIRVWHVAARTARDARHAQAPKAALTLPSL
jgi:hypothetical protein